MSYGNWGTVSVRAVLKVIGLQVASLNLRFYNLLYMHSSYIQNFDSYTLYRGFTYSPKKAN